MKEIDSVSTFINEIKILRDAAEENSTGLYFRGQEVDYWEIKPSIFRDDMLSREDKLMQIPLQKNPMEFKELSSDFDIMAKYQHYGMCTRLLDLTTNPLVALYFACKAHGVEEFEIDGEKVEKEPDGVVYYADKYYPCHSTDLEVRIISALAKYDLSKENTIEYVLEKLVGENIINSLDKELWLTKNGVVKFIDIIQRNYMVVPMYANERLRRQNGVFLLAGMFSVEINGEPKDGIITKCKSNLRKEFSEHYFCVRGENKEEILKELDLYNINEATLFPELEHQLSYIKYVNSSCTQSVSEFFLYENNGNEGIDFVDVDGDCLNKHILDNLNILMNSIIDESFIDGLHNIIHDNFVVDWYKRENAFSKLKMEIASFLIDKEYSKDDAKTKANEFIDRLKTEVDNYCKNFKSGDLSGH